MEVKVKYLDRGTWRTMLSTCHPGRENEVIEKLKKQAYHVPLKPVKRRRKKK